MGPRWRDEKGPVKSNPGAAATGITRTGVSGGAGPLAFGYIVEGTSYGTAWTVAGTAALVGRRMLLRGYPRLVSIILIPFFGLNVIEGCGTTSCP